MTDPADRRLEERLHALARGVGVPVVPSADDVRRGRRRLLRLRVAMAGGTTATLAAVVGITSLTAGSPRATEIPPASDLSTALPTSPSAASDTPSPPGRPPTASRSEQAHDAAPPVGGAPEGSGRLAAGALPPGRSQVDQGKAQAGADPAQHVTLPATGSGVLPPPAPTASQVPTDSPSGSPTDPTTTPSPVEPTPTGGTRIGLGRALALFNAVLAEHLDPGRDHLQPYDRLVDPKVARRAGGLLFALGSTYRWQGGGTPAGLEITVASGWDQVDWGCGATYADWACHAADSNGGRAEVATHDGVRAVAVEHADGQVVVVSGTTDSSEADLVAAAADDRLALPGPAAQAPPTIDSADFASAGVAALVSDDESFDQTARDRSPFVRGTWSTADRGGTLAWWARPTYSGGVVTCLATDVTCVPLVVDASGTTVYVARLRKHPGWVVRYDGPSYAVRVWSSDRSFPKKRAVAFVTQDVWQPAR